MIQAMADAAGVVIGAAPTASTCCGRVIVWHKSRAPIAMRELDHQRADRCNVSTCCTLRRIRNQQSTVDIRTGVACKGSDCGVHAV